MGAPLRPAETFSGATRNSCGWSVTARDARAAAGDWHGTSLSAPLVSSLTPLTLRKA